MLTIQGWQPISDLPDKPGSCYTLLADDNHVMGQFTGMVNHPVHGVSWFIDGCYYDGDREPKFFFVVPPLPEDPVNG